MRLPALALLALTLTSETTLSQSKQGTTLCDLRGKVAEGDHLSVTVTGVYEGGMGNSGPAMGTLDDAACPDQAAWVEIMLESSNNRKKLDRLLQHSRRARVVFEGELYGPPEPDPNLPEAIRKVYHPGWGHLGAFKTKLVVRAIREAATAPHE